MDILLTNPIEVELQPRITQVIDKAKLLQIVITLREIPTETKDNENTISVFMDIAGKRNSEILVPDLDALNQSNPTMSDAFAVIIDGVKQLIESKQIN